MHDLVAARNQVHLHSDDRAQISIATERPREASRLECAVSVIAMKWPRGFAFAIATVVLWAV